MKRTISSEMVIVATILGLGVAAMSILRPILPLYLTSIGTTPKTLGLMLSVGWVGMVIGESSWGWVADKIGLKIPLSIGTFVCALSVLLFALTQNALAIFSIFFFWGLVCSALFGPGRGYIGANTPPLKKATFMAILTIMMKASGNVGALASGFIVDTWGYHWVFFISCGISILGGVVVITGLKKAQPIKPEPPAVTPSHTDKLPSPVRAFSYRSLTPQCVIASLALLGLGISTAFLPLLATQVVGVKATEVGILFTIGGLTTMVLCIPLGMLADRKGKRGFMILGLLVSAAATAGVAFAGSFLWLIVFTIIQSLGMAMFNPAALGLLSNSVPLHRQSTAMGIYGGICENTGIVAGSALGGLVWSTWGPRGTFLTGAIAASLGAVICFVFVRGKTPKNSPIC